MSFKKIFLLVSTCFLINYVVGQQRYDSIKAPEIEVKLHNSYSFVYYKVDGQYTMYYAHYLCKGNMIRYEFIPNVNTIQDTNQIVQVKVIENIQNTKIKFLTIHGSVNYEYFYRSQTDTPFNQSAFKQHAEKVNLQLVIKEKYPFRLSFNSRQTNNSLFRNFIDPNLNFDHQVFATNIKKNILDKIMKQIPETYDIKMAELTLNAEKNKLNEMKMWLKDPATLQRIIEEREKDFRTNKLKEKSLSQNQINEFDLKSHSKIKMGTYTNDYAKYTKMDSTKSLKNSDFIDSSIKRDLATTISDKNEKLMNKKDSVISPLTKKFNNTQKLVQEKEEKIKALQYKLDSLKYAKNKDIMLVRQKIQSASNEKDIKKIAKENNINIDSTTGLQKILLNLKTLNIGRTVLNYSELTAKNIIITGVNIEYNPSWYAAFSAGRIDFRFRDFFNNGGKGNDQFLTLGRFGYGNKEKRAIIFSFFTGKRSQSEYIISDTVQNHINIVGYSVQTVFKKDQNTFLTAEFAKSTKPIAGFKQDSKQMNQLWRLRDNTNNGFNVEAQTIIPETETKLSGFFRKTGENFQSFSLFSYNSNQTAWLTRVDQSILKRKLILTGMLRRNDFTNPFAERTFKSSTIFKTLQLNIRIPKYPFVSLGYYPGSQLNVVNNEKVREYIYYVLNASVVYNYYYKNVGMNSSFIYNRFVNKATDSGFVANNGVNYYISQTALFKQWQLQAGYSYNKQPELMYHTTEAYLNYAFKNILKLGAGYKYNKVLNGLSYWGSRALVGLDFEKIGSVQFQYEKSYLPTISQTLFPIETGRISLYKIF